MPARIPLYLQKGVSSLPVTIYTNPFPYAVLCNSPHAYISSLGWDSISGAYGRAKVEKFSLDTAAKIGEADLGQYTAHGGGEMAICDGALHVQDQGSGELVQIDPATMAETTRVTVGALNRGLIAYSGKLYSTVGSANQVKKINPATMTVEATGSTAGAPYRMTIANGELYVFCFSGTVSVLDADTLATIATIPITVGHKPNGGYTDPVTGMVYNLCYGTAGVPGGDYINVIDPTTRSVVSNWPVMQNAGLHSMRRVNDELWVTCSATHYLQCVNPTNGAIIRTRQSARDPAFMDFDGGSLWVPCALDNIVQVWPTTETYG
jgi:YVTN family beta-propeller protein